MIPSSLLYKLSDPDFVNMDSKALYPSRKASNSIWHSSSRTSFFQSIIDLVFITEHTYHSKCYMHNYKSNWREESCKEKKKNL